MKKLASFLFFTFLFFTFYFLLFTFPARASFISLNTTLTSHYEHGRLLAKVSVLNKGDEPAYNVRAEFKAGGQALLAKKSLSLPIGGTYQAEQAVPLSLALPGTYPLTLIMHYTDANQYPFSALTLQTFIYRQEAPAPIVGRVNSTAFDKEGNLSFKLKNSGERPITTKTTLIVPAELSVKESQRALVIEPGSEQGSGFSVQNFSALSGSTYQVFAVTEFDDGGLHHTAIAPGIIKISTEHNFLGLDAAVYVVILIVLIVLFIGAQFLRKK
jgi:hypothetical protein